jgi:hypothetical protein
LPESWNSRYPHETAKSLINVGKAQNAQDQINSILTISNDKLKDLSNSIIETSSSKQKLETTTNQLEQSIERLDKTVEQLDAKALLAKLNFDFHRVRDFSAKVTYVFKTPILAEKLGSLELDGDDLHLPGPDSEIARFHREGDQLIMGSIINRTVSRLRFNYVMYGYFDDLVYNRPISDFQTLDTAVYRLRTKRNEQPLLDEAMANTEKIELKVMVNWMPLWTFKFTPNQIISSREEDESKYTLLLTKIIPDESKTVVQRYEELFADTEGQREADKKPDYDLMTGVITQRMK